MKKVIIALTFVVSIGSVPAQELRSSYFMETSMFRHQMNPAFIDYQYVAVPFLGNINVRTSGKNGSSTFLYPLEDNSDYDRTTFMNPEIDSQTFLRKIKNQVNFNANLNYTILSGAFRAFGGANLVELNLRSNTYSTIPHSFFVFMKAPQTKQRYDFDRLGLRSETYAELVLGHSRKLSRKVTLGGKLKFLLGGSYAQYKVNHLNVTQSGNQWIVEGNTELEAAVFNSKFKYNGNQVRGLTKPTFGLPGFGAAIDLGIVYNASSYIDGLTLSASVTDLGYIAWRDVNTASSQGTWNFSGFRNLPVYESDSGVTIKDQAKAMKSELANMLALYDQGQTNVGKMLPLTLTLGAEYVLPSYDKLHFGALFSRRFMGLHSFSQMMFSTTARPIDWLEASLSTSVIGDNISFGGVLNFYTRRFNFYIGSDRFFGKLLVNSFNANVNVGVTIPLEDYYQRRRR